MIRTKHVFIFKLFISLIIIRNYGNIIHDIANNHDGQLPLSKLRKLEKLYIKIDKAKLDIHFLTNCRKLGVVPKFLNFNLPYTNSNDTRAIRKRLLKSAVRKRIKEKLKL